MNNRRFVSYNMTNIELNKYYEFIRFSIVGTISAIVHFIVYLLFLWLFDIEWSADGSIGWQHNVAYAIGYSISLIGNLFMTAKFTFRQNIKFKTLIFFLASHGFNFVIQECLLNTCLLLGVANWLALPLVLLIATPVNFLMVRMVFKHF